MEKYCIKPHWGVLLLIDKMDERELTLLETYLDGTNTKDAEHAEHAQDDAERKIKEILSLLRNLVIIEPLLEGLLSVISDSKIELLEAFSQEISVDYVLSDKTFEERMKTLYSNLEKPLDESRVRVNIDFEHFDPKLFMLLDRFSKTISDYSSKGDEELKELIEAKHKLFLELTHLKPGATELVTGKLSSIKGGAKIWKALVLLGTMVTHALSQYPQSSQSPVETNGTLSPLIRAHPGEIHEMIRPAIITPDQKTYNLQNTISNIPDQISKELTISDNRFNSLSNKLYSDQSVADSSLKRFWGQGTTGVSSVLGTTTFFKQADIDALKRKIGTEVRQFALDDEMQTIVSDFSNDEANFFAHFLESLQNDQTNEQKPVEELGQENSDMFSLKQINEYNNSHKDLLYTRALTSSEINTYVIKAGLIAVQQTPTIPDKDLFFGMMTFHMSLKNTKKHVEIYIKRQASIQSFKETCKTNRLGVDEFIGPNAKKILSEPEKFLIECLYISESTPTESSEIELQMKCKTFIDSFPATEDSKVNAELKFAKKKVKEIKTKVNNLLIETKKDGIRFYPHFTERDVMENAYLSDFTTLGYSVGRVGTSVLLDVFTLGMMSDSTSNMSENGLNHRHKHLFAQKLREIEARTNQTLAKTSNLERKDLLDRSIFQLSQYPRGRKILQEFAPVLLAAKGMTIFNLQEVIEQGNLSNEIRKQVGMGELLVTSVLELTEQATYNPKSILDEYYDKTKTTLKEEDLAGISKLARKVQTSSSGQRTFYQGLLRLNGQTPTSRGEQMDRPEVKVTMMKIFDRVGMHFMSLLQNEILENTANNMEYVGTMGPGYITEHMIANTNVLPETMKKVSHQTLDYVKDLTTFDRTGKPKNLYDIVTQDLEKSHKETMKLALEEAKKTNEMAKEVMTHKTTVLFARFQRQLADMKLDTIHEERSRLLESSKVCNWIYGATDADAEKFGTDGVYLDGEGKEQTAIHMTSKERSDIVITRKWSRSRELFHGRLILASTKMNEESKQPEPPEIQKMKKQISNYENDPKLVGVVAALNQKISEGTAIGIYAQYPNFPVGIMPYSETEKNAIMKKNVANTERSIARTEMEQLEAQKLKAQRKRDQFYAYIYSSDAFIYARICAETTAAISMGFLLLYGLGSMVITVMGQKIIIKATKLFNSIATALLFIVTLPVNMVFLPLPFLKKKIWILMAEWKTAGHIEAAQILRDVNDKLEQIENKQNKSSDGALTHSTAVNGTSAKPGVFNNYLEKRVRGGYIKQKSINVKKHIKQKSIKRKKHMKQKSIKRKNVKKI